MRNETCVSHARDVVPTGRLAGLSTTSAAGAPLPAAAGDRHLSALRRVRGPVMSSRRRRQQVIHA